MIAIKEMNIPNRCAKCKFCLRQGTYGKCLLQKNKRVSWLAWNRDDNCPLVKIATCKDCKSIKVLDKEPCEDVISRKEVKKLAWDLELETCYDNERVVEMLDDLPSVTLVPKKCHN